MSPGMAPERAVDSDDGVTAFMTAFAAATGMAHVEAVVIAVVEPPSGSVSVSAISQVLPGSRSNRLPECLLFHWPLPEPKEPVSFDPAGTRTSGIPFFQALVPDSRYLTVTTPLRLSSPVIAH